MREKWCNSHDALFCVFNVLNRSPIIAAQEPVRCSVNGAFIESRPASGENLSFMELLNPKQGRKGMVVVTLWVLEPTPPAKNSNHPYRYWSSFNSSRGLQHEFRSIWHQWRNVTSEDIHHDVLLQIEAIFSLVTHQFQFARLKEAFQNQYNKQQYVIFLQQLADAATWPFNWVNWDRSRVPLSVVRAKYRNIIDKGLAWTPDQVVTLVARNSRRDWCISLFTSWYWTDSWCIE